MTSTVKELLFSEEGEMDFSKSGSSKHPISQKMLDDISASTLKHFNVFEDEYRKLFLIWDDVLGWQYFTVEKHGKRQFPS